MANAIFQVPSAKNEPVLGYTPGSPERAALKETLAAYKARQTDCPMYINGQWVTTNDKRPIHPPHDLQHTLGFYHEGTAEHVQQAIEAALAAREAWENMPWQERAAIFLKAADLISGPYRAQMNAATMLGQSKNVFQAEIDAVAELCDFLRFNVQFMTEIYQEQPSSSPQVWNRMEYRGLEGFVFALTPFNFTAISGNLPSSAAMMGNVVVWKPAHTQIFAARLVMQIFEEAGLPPGVINLIYVEGRTTGDVIFSHPKFAGLHFTGSTGVFQHLWKTIGNNISKYHSYPRIVGETGGKDFVIAHPTADWEHVAVALARGAFEYQGQKCSAASRAYLPKSLWPAIKERLVKDLASFKMGSVEDFSCFVNAVIDEKAFDKITGYIAQATKDAGVEIVAGGGYDKTKGYFI
ncbi:MAG: aldehyde dehydrogenase family protein, partial [Lewinella sp.]|nr:aldehyde dehydrogenase family protein [Lewinella sp.]